MLAHPTVNRREEQLVLREGDLWGVGAALKVNGLQVGAAVVEDNLRGKIEEASGLGREFVSDQREGLSFDQAQLREGSERIGGVLEHFEQAWRIAGVADADGLVDRLKWAARLEVDPVAAQLDHGDERLRARGKGVTAARQVDEQWWVDLLIRKVSIL